MDTLTTTTGHDVDRFEPTRFHVQQAANDYAIKHAKRIRDWPALERAIDDKIAEQKKFLAWWQGSVRRPGQPEKYSPTPRLITCPDAERLTGMTHQRVAELGKRLQAPDSYRQRLLGVAYREALLEAEPNRSPLAALGQVGETSVEWFTPSEYIDMSREVMGEIDLDPASCPLAQQTVKAKKFFSVADNGLDQEWHGRIFLNAPYGRALGEFAAKLLREIEAGRVTEAHVLTCNATDATWFQNLAMKADAICFPQGRIQFTDSTGKKSGNVSGGQAFFYFGPNVTTFVEVFGPKCWIAVSYK